MYIHLTIAACLHEMPISIIKYFNIYRHAPKYTQLVQCEVIWSDSWPVMFGPCTEKKSKRQDAKRRVRGKQWARKEKLPFLIVFIILFPGFLKLAIFPFDLDSMNAQYIPIAYLSFCFS